MHAPTPIALACLCMSLLVAGCATISLPDLEGRTQRYFGLVRIEVPTVDENISAVRTSAFGMTLRDGVTLGWESSEHVYVPLNVSEPGNLPYEATCSVVVIVRDMREAESVREMLSTVAGEDVCISQFGVNE